MPEHARKLSGIAAIITMATAAPLTLNFHGTNGDFTKVIRVNDACGQATSCIVDARFICSTYHQDYPGYACATGCGKDPE
jgi:hypothetical protein